MLRVFFVLVQKQSTKSVLLGSANQGSNCERRRTLAYNCKLSLAKTPHPNEEEEDLFTIFSNPTIHLVCFFFFGGGGGGREGGREEVNKVY